MNIKKFQALLEMIEPGHNYDGGMVSYEAAAEYLDRVPVWFPLRFDQS